MKRDSRLTSESISSGDNVVSLVAAAHNALRAHAIAINSSDADILCAYLSLGKTGVRLGLDIGADPDRLQLAVEELWSLLPASQVVRQ